MISYANPLSTATDLKATAGHHPFHDGFSSPSTSTPCLHHGGTRSSAPLKGLLIHISYPTVVQNPFDIKVLLSV
ncbi:hypothetical protein PAHAL_9G364500 [Panicum hallii]|uniref:Uncharacterized protein n=1 Tax=Panicum hallii TaxID=206008 RepID=A0A2S3IP01_9POAL|nr:hypothetical protein PAHAL_9G364500 [Panicum hallii]